MTIVEKLINSSTRSRAAEKPGGANTYQAMAELAGSLRGYQDMSWNVNREWLAMFLAGVMLLGMVAGMYLNVTARAAIEGRDIQRLEGEIDSRLRENADLQTQLAILLSNNVLSARASAMGYEPVIREDVEYMVVPGYFPAQGVNLVQPVSEPVSPLSSPEFSESLFDWISRQIASASKPLK